MSGSLWCDYCKSYGTHNYFDCYKKSLRCTFCGGGGHIQADCLKKGKSKDVTFCTYCKKAGHSKYTCKVAKIRCELCGGGAHTKEQCKINTCKNCSSFVHKTEDCPEPLTLCINCDKLGHKSVYCQIKNVCDYCGEVHLTKNCPHDPCNQICVKCKSKGHTILMCTSRE